MENSYLGRDEAPIGSDIWKVLDGTMVEAAKGMMTGRRLLHIEGPYGLGLKAVPLQDSRADNGLSVSGLLPVSFIHKTFSLSKRDLAASEREGIPINASAVASTAIEAAMQEESLIFRGVRGVPGLLHAKGASELKLSAWGDMGKAVEDIISAITLLDKAGFHGPYALALAPSRYNLLFRRYPQGGTELEYVQAIVTEGVFKAPILESGGVLIASGSQYAAIVLGQDMSIGFNDLWARAWSSRFQRALLSLSGSLRRSACSSEIGPKEDASIKQFKCRPLGRTLRAIQSSGP